MRTLRLVSPPVIGALLLGALLLGAAVLAAGRGLAADLPGPADLDALRPGPTVPGLGPGSGPGPGSPPADADAAEAAEAERLAVQGFGDRNPACLAWGDGCVTCLKDAAGAPVCSNPGPACLPRETACTRVRDVPPEPGQK